LEADVIDSEKLAILPGQVCNLDLHRNPRILKITDFGSTLRLKNPQTAETNQSVTGFYPSQGNSLL